MKHVKISKKFAVASFKKAHLENYDYRVVAEFDSEADALRFAEAQSESDNAVQGTVLLMNHDGRAVMYE